MPIEIEMMSREDGLVLIDLVRKLTARVDLLECCLAISIRNAEALERKQTEEKGRREENTSKEIWLNAIGIDKHKAGG